MRAGTLRHRIVIEQRSSTALDAYGGRTGDWQEYLTTYAAFEPQSGREFVANNAQASVQSVRFVIRWYSGVTPKMRVVFDGKKYDIRAVLDDRGRRRQMTLVCDEGETAGG